MGRIKTTLIKRNASKLHKRYPDRFKQNFQKNKEALGELAEIKSKKIRNIIAGYLTKLAKQED